MGKQNVRDYFWNYIYEKAQIDHDIVIVSADLGAMSLDAFRDNLPAQFISVGIAEQAAIEIAAGLALGGKKVYVYACAPFIFMRCYEQIKLCIADANLPITIVSQGMGVCYSESGATHHTLEDVGAIRMLPRINMLTPTDEKMALEVAKYTYLVKSPTYVRLDRPMPDELYDHVCIEDGFGVIMEPKEKIFISNGQMLHKLYEEINEQREMVGLIDLFSTRPNEDKLVDLLSKCQDIFVLEEHSVIGGIGSFLLELCNRRAINSKIHVYGLNSRDGYVHRYGSREQLWKLYGIDMATILKDIG